MTTKEKLKQKLDSLTVEAKNKKILFDHSCIYLNILFYYFICSRSIYALCLGGRI